LHSTSLDAEGRRDSILLYGFLFIGRHLCQKYPFWNELDLACLRTLDTCMFQYLMEEQVQEIPLPHMQSIHRDIHFMLFKKECPRLSVVAKNMISTVGHWYLDEHDTYIKVFRSIEAPHLLPVYFPVRLVVGEICYQTILPGYNDTLIKDKKREFIPYGFHIGFYMVKNTAQAK